MKRYTDNKYDPMIQPDGIMSADEWISGKFENLHLMLLNEAIKKLWNSNEYEWTSLYSIDELKVTEQKRDSFMEAPVCTFMTCTWPYRKWKVDMKPYWNNEFISHVHSTIPSNLTKDYNIVSLNYSKGTAKVKDKVNDRTTTIPFHSINKDTTIQIDEFESKDTFTYLYNQNRSRKH